ncbi:MAG: hypothetical protein HEQ23_10060 [Tepidisphaera sp.]
MAIDGDTMVVGSPYSDLNGQDAGAVFVYRKIGGVWTQEAVLTYGGPGWWLGWSVAISGDTIIAGAPGVPRNAMSFGGVFEFRRSGNTWNLYQGYTNGSDQQGYYTGTSVAIAGNMMVYGSQPSAGGGIGYSFTFDRASPASAFVIRMTSPHGWIVATDGNQFATTSASSGTLLVVQRPLSNNWSEAFYEFASLPSNESLSAANSLAIKNNTLIVGSPGYDGIAGRVNQGAVYVFERIGQSLVWNPTLRIIDPDNTDQDFFGWSVGFDNTNPDRFAVGSVWANTGGQIDAGAVFVFERDGLSEWRQIRRESALDADEGDQLGMSVAMSGGFVAAGAPTDDQQSLNAGAAYVFAIDPQRPGVDGGPDATTVRVGQTAVLSVIASGPGPLTYQWRKDGRALTDGGRIAGSRTSSLRIRLCRWSDMGLYECVVSNGCGGTTSEPAMLTVTCPADFNDDGFLDFFDYDEFVTAFETGDPRADFNADGFIDFFDYDDFVAAFETGC